MANSVQDAVGAAVKEHGFEAVLGALIVVAHARDGELFVRGDKADVIEGLPAGKWSSVARQLRGVLDWIKAQRTGR